MKNIINKNHAFLFQGVGTGYQEKLHLLNEEQMEVLDNYCSIVYKEIEMDLRNYLFKDSITKYDKLFYDWIAIYTIDYIIFNTYIEMNIKPDLFLGYSMGLITAMTCGKSISFESGLHMLLEIYEYPRYSSREEEAMAVIVGMTIKDVDSIICSNNLENCVGIASENNEYCIVISGNSFSVDKVMSIAEAEGALKVKRINAPYAFHFQYAQGGIEKYISFVEKLQVLDCPIPIMSSFNQEIIRSSFDLKKELIKNMTYRMYWKTSIEKIADLGIQSFVEVSLETNISKFSKLINSSFEFLTYKKLLSLQSKKNKIEFIGENEESEKVS